jgi:DNA-binding transcriptional MerR regulator
MPEHERYSLTELADLAGVTPRTVRYYLAQGLLPAVGQSGPGSKYDAGHLARLRLIRRLQAEHLPLAEIRRRLDDLDDDQIRELTGSDAPAPPPDSALDYLRAVLGSGAGRARSLPTPGVRVPPPMRVQSHRPLLSATIAPAPSAPSKAIAEGLGESYGSTLATSPVAAATRPLERSQWERVVLAADVELHIRRPLARAQNKQVDRLITIARELLEKDRP